MDYDQKITFLIFLFFYSPSYSYFNFQFYSHYVLFDKLYHFTCEICLCFCGVCATCYNYAICSYFATMNTWTMTMTTMTMKKKILKMMW